MGGRTYKKKYKPLLSSFTLIMKIYKNKTNKIAINIELLNGSKFIIYFKHSNPIDFLQFICSVVNLKTIQNQHFVTVKQCKSN